MAETENENNRSVLSQVKTSICWKLTCRPPACTGRGSTGAGAVRGSTGAGSAGRTGASTACRAWPPCSPSSLSLSARRRRPCPPRPQAWSPAGMARYKGTCKTSGELQYFKGFLAYLGRLAPQLGHLGRHQPEAPLASLHLPAGGEAAPRVRVTVTGQDPRQLVSGIQVRII